MTVMFERIPINSIQYGRNTEIPPLTRTVASTITIQGVRDEENGKLPTAHQGEPLPFVSLVLDCAFVVVCENTALFCSVKYRTRFPFQSAFIAKKQKPRMRELNELQKGI